jgi:hypothetical protein
MRVTVIMIPALNFVRATEVVIGATMAGEA